MKKLLALISLLIVCLFLYGKYIEVKNLTIKEYTIYNEDIPDTFKDLKIVHFTDILYTSKSDNTLDNIIKKINEQKPDIIIFGGDLFNKNEKYSDNDYEKLKEYLSKLDANLFKFAIIGDNDEFFIDSYKDILYESGFTLLDNKNQLVFYKDITPINIIGVTNVDNIESLLETDITYNYSLVITHKPDLVEKLKVFNINTILSGHSLGGIINVPFYGGLIKKDGAELYINDYYKVNNTELYISNGIGYEKFNFRLFNTPSFNVYRFDN